MAGKCAEILQALADLFPEETGVAHSAVTFDVVDDVATTPAVLVRHGRRIPQQVHPDDRSAKYQYEPYLDCVIGPADCATAGDVGTALVNFEEMILAVLSRHRTLKNQANDPIAQSLTPLEVAPQAPTEAQQRAWFRVTLRLRFVDEYSEREPIKAIQTFKLSLVRYGKDTSETLDTVAVNVDLTAL